jgi:streptogramin lyase
VFDFVFGPDGDIWFSGPDYIGEMTQAGVLLHDYSIPSADEPAATTTAISLTLGPDGNIWYTEPYVSSDIVGRLTPSGQITEFPIPFGSNGAAYITTGPDGNLWFEATSENAIGRITPSGVLTIFNDPATTRVYRGLTSGPNGNLWATTNEYNTIVEFNTSGQLVATFPVSGSPYGMTEGPDGNLWYDEHAANANNIGQLTPQGAVTEFPIPTPDSEPSIPIAGPDGNIWFAEYNTDKIGEVVLDVPTTTTLTSSASTSSFGQPLTLTATVTANSGSGTPTGSVDFFDSTTGNDLGSVALSSGVATLNTASLPVGSQTITASYGGQSPFLPSSATITVSIGPSIIVTNPAASGALTVSGNASINIPGEIVVDSSSTSALSAAGNAQIMASAIDVQGGFQETGNATISPAPTTDVSVADPLGTLGTPSPTGLTSYGPVSFTTGTHTICPGIYTQIKVSGNASLTLSAGSGGSPGIYIIEGGGLTVTGGASLSDQDVFIYNTGSNYPGSGGNFGGITLSGSGTFALTAPASGPYAGVVIFQSRANTRALSLSGNAMAGVSGIIYAPSALLSFSGNSQLQAALDVGMLNLSGNVALTQMAAGGDGTGDTSGIANTLLAGNLSVYINDPSGLFTADELARIQDAINAWDAILAPYSVTITEVSDPTQANIVIDTGSTSACGSAANGVLGCFNAPNAEITMLQGWNWYAGSDPTQIGSGQYDFETTVLHELGHALGLGGSTNPASPMYETLAAGVADRTPTTQDLNIPDPPEDADPQMAAGFLPGPAAPIGFPNGHAVAPGPAAVPGPAGLMPLPSASGQWSVVSGQWSAAGGPAGSPVGPETTLVVQGTDPADGRGRVIRIDPEATDLSLALDVSEPIAEPPGLPATNPPIDPEPRAIPEGPDRTDGPAAIPVGSPAGRVIDAALDELTSAAGPMLAGDSIAVAPVAFERVRPEGPSRRAGSPGERRDWPSRLAAILLAASWFGVHSVSSHFSGSRLLDRDGSGRRRELG